MSRERAVRRVAREAAAAEERQKRSRRRASQRRRGAARSALVAPVRTVSARGRRVRQGPRRSRAEIAVVIVAVLALQLLVRAYTSDLGVRLAILLASLVAAPALRVLVRGRSRD